MTVIERYQNLKRKVVDRADSFAELMEHLERNTEWMTAPASTRFHLCKEGGLLEHSVNVAETLLKIKGLLAPEISDESCVIVGLLHDLGKAGTTEGAQYLKNEPTERQRQYGYGPTYPYSFNKDLTYLSVPVRS
ncbi:MAG: HD domain-containing protein, partial [Clostridiales bacterium]|nr:HD domain-containing protein [Clostridiales bacterium]